MGRRETVRGILDIFGPDAMADCKKLAVRFRRALMDANPELSEISMTIYDETFQAELPAMASALRDARIESATAGLRDDELVVWDAVLNVPNIAFLIQSLRAHMPNFQNTSDKVFQTLGVAAHSRSAERLFSHLADNNGPS